MFSDKFIELLKVASVSVYVYHKKSNAGYPAFLKHFKRPENNSDAAILIVFLKHLVVYDLKPDRAHRNADSRQLFHVFRIRGNKISPEIQGKLLAYPRLAYKPYELIKLCFIDVKGIVNYPDIIAFDILYLIYDVFRLPAKIFPAV